MTKLNFGPVKDEMHITNQDGMLVAIVERVDDAPLEKGTKRVTMKVGRYVNRPRFYHALEAAQYWVLSEYIEWERTRIK